MGILSFLSGNTKTVDKVIDAGINGIDALIFTEEEKAEYNKNLQELHLEFIKISASESTAQSISRRMICLPVVYVWLLLIIANTVAAVFAPGLDISAISKSIEAMSMPALAAIGFYVGRHMIASKPNRGANE